MHILKLLLIILLITSYQNFAYSADKSSPTLLGASVQLRPEYDGSRSTEMTVIPVLSYAKDIWFVRTTEGILEAGAKSALIGHLDYGIQAAYQEGRDSRSADFLKLHHVANIDPSVSLGGFLQYQNSIQSIPVDLVARYRKAIDSERGDQFDLRLTAGIYHSQDKKLSAQIFAQSTWANTKALQTYYGFTSNQAASSGLPEFHPSGGNLVNEVGLWCSYNLSSHWRLMGNIERHDLAGDAKDSPLSEVSHNMYYSLGAAYQY